MFVDVEISSRTNLWKFSRYLQGLCKSLKPQNCMKPANRRIHMHTVTDYKISQSQQKPTRMSTYIVFIEMHGKLMED